MELLSSNLLWTDAHDINGSSICRQTAGCDDITSDFVPVRWFSVTDHSDKSQFSQELASFQFRNGRGHLAHGLARNWLSVSVLRAVDFASLVSIFSNMFSPIELNCVSDAITLLGCPRLTLEKPGCGEPV